MSNYNINITENGSNSVPPVADPSALSIERSTGEVPTISYNNKTPYEVAISFQDTNAFVPAQFSVGPNSSKSVSVGQCDNAKYHYDIHYDGMPGPDTKPYVGIKSPNYSNTSSMGTPTQGISSTESH